MGTIEITLYRAADDDILTDCGSFAESLDSARAYLANPGYGGRRLWSADVTVDASVVLDLTEESDPAGVVAARIGALHPGAIGADEYVPRVSYELRAAGVEWVRVCESYPTDTITWIWVGGDDPEMTAIEA